MMLPIPRLLGADDLAECRRTLDMATWLDGRDTAGPLSAGVKRNAQLGAQDPVAVRLGQLVTTRLSENPLFLSAALPHAILPPLFNRYAGGGHYGSHIDGAIRAIDGGAHRIRTDLSMTVMLTDPDDYDGGELVIEDHFGDRPVKLAAGDAILYPATSIHHVRPVTRGVRLAAFTWIQSLVRDGNVRAQLFDLDDAIQQLPDDEAGHAARLRLTNVYHNLLRHFAEL